MTETPLEPPEELDRLRRRLRDRRFWKEDGTHLTLTHVERGFLIAAIDYALSSRAPQAGGWQTVPKVATKEMCDAGGEAFLAGVVEHEPGHLSGVKRPFQKYYQAMLAAAPVAPQAGGDAVRRALVAVANQDEYLDMPKYVRDIIDRALASPTPADEPKGDYDREAVNAAFERGLPHAMEVLGSAPKGDVRGALSSVDYHQQRGMARDIINEALNSYREYMLDDDFDAQRTLDKIMARMQARSEALTTPSQDEGEAHDLERLSKLWINETRENEVLHRALEELLAADVSLRDRNRPEYQEILKRASEALSRFPEDTK